MTDKNMPKHNKLPTNQKPQLEVQSSSYKISCHFKQIDGDECFAYHFVDKKECQTCWKRYRFISEYLPQKMEYEKRFADENTQKVVRQSTRRFVTWGGTIIDNEIKDIKTFEKGGKL